MGASKTDEYSQQQISLAAMFKALGHPARVAIIQFILKAESCICGDIVNELPLSQPTVSQHLKELKSAGIIHGNVEGNAICYCLNDKTVTLLKDYFGSLTDQIQLKNSNCC